MTAAFYYPLVQHVEEYKPAVAIDDQNSVRTYQSANFLARYFVNLRFGYICVHFEQKSSHDVVVLINHAFQRVDQVTELVRGDFVYLEVHELEFVAIELEQRGAGYLVQLFVQHKTVFNIGRFDKFS